MNNNVAGTAITHLATRVCHRVIRRGSFWLQRGPTSLVAKPRAESTAVFTMVAPRNPHIMMSRER